MNEMLERVANEIGCVFGDAPPDKVLRAARAAIAAMREPTPEIREQVKQAIWKNTWGDAALDQHWRNMIGATLAPSPAMPQTDD